MRVVIEKSKFNGKVSAISSKSHAHRALICAALSKSESKIECYNLSKKMVVNFLKMVMYYQFVVS